MRLLIQRLLNFRIDGMRLVLAVTLIGFFGLIPNPTACSQDAEKRTEDNNREKKDEFSFSAPWGSIRHENNALICTIDRLDGRVLPIPKLNNAIGKIYLGSDGAKKELQLKPFIEKWEIVLPEQLSRGDTVLIEIFGEPRLANEPVLVLPDSNDSVMLNACDASTHGKNLRYEPQPHKNTIGYWSNVDDWVDWQFSIKKPGEYKVEIYQGCGKGQGGSAVEIAIGEKKISYVVEDTGHFQKFVWRELGAITLEGKGNHTLEIRGKKKEKAAIMDVRAVRLTPTK